MHSNYDIHFVKNLPFKHITKLIIDAKEKENRNNAWEMWVAKYAQMTKETFIDFESFYEKLKQSSVPEPEEPPKTRIQNLFNKLRPKVMSNGN